MVEMDTMRRAIEQRDGPLLSSLYADDAVLKIVDRLHPPSAPMEIRGKSAITESFNDICGRAISHRIEQNVIGDKSTAFTEACEYPDGNRVLCSALLDWRDGKVIRQVNVQAWDE